MSTTTGRACLGPLSDLEPHLSGEWWRHLFNSIYLRTDADVVENCENTRREVDEILLATSLKPQDRVLDLCCGQGRHCIDLAMRGFPNITGIDRSRYLIRLARKRANEQELSSIQFREGDARKIRAPDQTFDLVTVMGNSFGYFEREEENEKVLREICRVLKPEGRIYLDVTDGAWMKEHFAPQSWEWIDQTLLVCRERHLAKDRCRLIAREMVIDANKGVMKDQFYAERLYTEDELIELLHRAGFQQVSRYQVPQVRSTRASPDLGMMAHRMTFVATVGQRLRPSRPHVGRGSRLHCAVLLGDPRLPDRVKRDGLFNPEDLATVARLKEALGELTGYRFYFADDHAKLVKNLVDHRPSFVLNFCDEGFRNDPLAELHVPALLEMLDIPYSGAGPSCLATCYNKALTRAWANELDIATPEELWVDSMSSSVAIPAEFPALVKPAWGDSSIGITEKAVVHSADQLIDYCDWVRDTLPETPLLVQEFLSGTEYSVGVLGNPEEFTLLPILEVDYSELPQELPPILGYESKWLPGSPYWTDVRYREAQLPDSMARELYDKSILLFQRFGCRDYARFDFRANASGVIKLLEVNPNPGWCWDGKLNLMAGFRGWSYQTLLGKILRSGHERCGL